MGAKKITPPVTKLQTGSVVNGCYLVTKRLTTGFQADLYLVRLRHRNYTLAVLKIFNESQASGPEVVQAWKNELLSACSVEHNSVVKVLETFHDSENWGMVLEYIGGGDLRSKMAEGQVFSPGRVVRLLRQLCSGVAAIHAAGLIHCDLKPENVLLTETGTAKIADFGVARSAVEHHDVPVAGLSGTLDYMSPEYVLEGRMLPNFDLYSLGVIAYELLCGNIPFSEGETLERLKQRITSDPLAPCEINSACPAELSRIVLKALSRDPSQRYQSAEELQADLDVLARGWEGTLGDSQVQTAG